MKKTILIVVAILFCAFLFGEGSAGLTLDIGYRSASFTSNNIGFNADFFHLGAGFGFVYYPSYDSHFGFSLNPMIMVDRLLASEISGSQLDDLGKRWSLNEMLSGFYTDFAINYRFPLDFNENYLFLRLGGGITVESEVSDYNEHRGHGGKTSYDENYKGRNFTLSGVLEFGWQPIINGSGFSTLSIRFVYDFCTNNSITGYEFIHPNSFGISLVWRPLDIEAKTKKDIERQEEINWQYQEKIRQEQLELESQEAEKKRQEEEEKKQKEEVRKQTILKMLENEDKYSEYYELCDIRKRTINDIDDFAQRIANMGYSTDNFSLNEMYYRRINDEKTDWMDYSEAFLRDIEITVHELGYGEPGTYEYLQFKSKSITLPFYTAEEKNAALDKIIEECNIRKQQKARIEKNKQLNPDDYNYQNLLVLNMATIENSKVVLDAGCVYIAEHFSTFHIINKLLTTEYNIGRYNSDYQFVLLNGSDESIEVALPDKIYFQYLGTREVRMANGYIRYLPWFNMIKSIKPEDEDIRKIIAECQNW